VIAAQRVHHDQHDTLGRVTPPEQKGADRDRARREETPEEDLAAPSHLATVAPTLTLSIRDGEHDLTPEISSV
jgi:hypothetical protein